MTNSKLKSKISEVKAQREAQELALSEATDVVEAFDWNDKDNASKDDIKALQTALKTLRHPVNTIDGIISPNGATEKAYKVEASKIQAAAQTAQTAAATEGVASAQKVLDRVNQ